MAYCSPCLQGRHADCRGLSCGCLNTAKPHPAPMTMPLTINDRYVEAGWLVTPFAARQAQVPVMRCRSCGALLLPGDEDAHERMHPPAGCDRVHPEMAAACPAGHPWEALFGPLGVPRDE